MTDKDLSEKVKNLCEALKVRLSVLKKGNIMEYGNFCNHDDNFLCKCRIDWIIERIKKEFE